MPQVGFKKQFVPKVMTEEKPFTLRALRKDGRDTKAGQTLYMFTGLRTKQCRKFAEKPCRFAVTVNLSWRSILIPTIGSLKTPALLESFSRLDGFESYAAFCEFHKITEGMTAKPMRLVAWITRDELAKLLSL
ncbi:MAG TPA: hypothetical protein VHY30_04490 [Verrucomicrobiae bacterium]|jgi:hypothetical protein|nr:hypothetical protein [Verrucomicrobiae bacterium]